jgi:hypothetical protein
MRLAAFHGTVLAAALAAASSAGAAERIVDLPTRPGATQRLLVVAPEGAPRATVILLPGGHGGLQLGPDGAFGWGKGNFLCRSRGLFAEQGFLVALVDAPSDRQAAPWLDGFRERPEHVADVRAVIAWARKEARAPVWLVGTSRGTISAAFVATELAGSSDGPDGLVLSSSILRDRHAHAVPELELHRLRLPVLAVHHRDDGCPGTPFSETQRLMGALRPVAQRELLVFQGGEDVGDPCQARGHHGFAGIEREVVGAIASWIVSGKAGSASR